MSSLSGFRSIHRTGVSPASFVVISTASIWSLRQILCLDAPCLRVCHSPSPRTLILVLSIRRWSEASRTAIGDIDRQGFLLTAQCAEIRHRVSKPDWVLRTFNKTRRLSQRKTEQDLFSVRRSRSQHRCTPAGGLPKSWTEQMKLLEPHVSSAMCL